MVEFNRFNDWNKTASAARNWTNSAPQTDAKTFALPSVSILLLWLQPCRAVNGASTRGSYLIRWLIICRVVIGASAIAAIFSFYWFLSCKSVSIASTRCSMLSSNQQSSHWLISALYCKSVSCVYHGLISFLQSCYAVCQLYCSYSFSLVDFFSAELWEVCQLLLASHWLITFVSIVAHFSLADHVCVNCS